MSTFDIILIFLLGLGAFKGYQHGLIMEIFSFLAFFLGLFVALELSIPVSMGLFGSSNFFGVGAVIVFFTLFILLSITIKAGAKAIKNVIDFTFFGTLDNLAGAVAGVFKWAFILSVVFWIFDSVGFDIVEKYSDDAIIFQYIVGIGPAVFKWVSGAIPIIQDLIDTMENLPEGGDSVLTLLGHYV